MTASRSSPPVTPTNRLGDLGDRMVVLEPGPRHQLFEAARCRADWSVQQLWLSYLGRGGINGALELEAYLHGLLPLSPGQQDVLASALNERLHDLYHTARVPYLFVPDSPPGRPEEVLTLLEEFIHAPPMVDRPGAADDLRGRGGRAPDPRE